MKISLIRTAVYGLFSFILFYSNISEAKYCGSCGHNNKDKNQYCTKCGNEFDYENINSENIDVPEKIQRIDYLVANISNIVFTYEDFNGLSIEELTLVRNYIYAKHGWKFSRKDLNNFFSKFSWYNPVNNNKWVESQLSKTERANVETIRKLEK